MMRIASTALAMLGLGGCVIASVRETAGEPVAGIHREYASPTALYAKHIIIPPGYATLRLPGIVPDPLNPGPAAAPRYGDTEQQTQSVLTKIAVALRDAGASEGDVVAMTVYLVKPEGAAGMDFDGLMRAYGRHYGSATQPNRPVRSTVEVAGLVRPSMLVEIEVTAAIPPRIAR